MNTATARQMQGYWRHTTTTNIYKNVANSPSLDTTNDLAINSLCLYAWDRESVTLKDRKIGQHGDVGIGNPADNAVRGHRTVSLTEYSRRSYTASSDNSNYRICQLEWQAAFSILSWSKYKISVFEPIIKGVLFGTVTAFSAANK